VEELADWQKRVAEASPETALSLADQMLGLQGKVNLEALQAAYGRVLLELVERAAGPELIVQIGERLARLPDFAYESLATALAQRVASLSKFSTAAAICQRIPSVKGYGASLVSQQAHGQALFALSSKASKVDEIVPLAVQVEGIPSFRDSPDLQFSYAKIVCNATAVAKSAQQAQTLANNLDGLPALASDPRLQEARQRAQRNQDRHRQTESAPATQPTRSMRPYVAAAAAILSVTLVAGALLRSPAPVVAATPRASGVFLHHMGLAKTALAGGDFNSASAYAKVSLEMTENETTRGQALDLLIEIFTRAGDFDKTLEYYAQLTSTELVKRTQDRLAAAQRALDAKKLEQAAGLASQAAGLLKLGHGSTQPAERLSARVLEAQGKLVAAAEILQRLGDSAASLRLLEQAKAYNKLVPLYESLGPKYHSQFMKTQRLLAAERVLESEKALLFKPEQGAAAARACLAGLQRVEGSQPLQARCHSVLAQAAFKQEHYKEATAAARQAVALQPSPKNKQRLALYRKKDAQTVSAEDLIRSENFAFEFPPALKTDKAYTYLYYLYPGNDYDKEIKEGLFQPPRDEFKAQLTYSRKDQGISFSVTTYESDNYSVTFSGGKLRSLAPGLFEEATRAPFNVNNPGLDFSGRGFNYNALQGQFVVHELVWGEIRRQNFRSE